MSSPFPGMNPYLENPELWPEVHSRLIVAIADAIESNLSQNYRVAIEKRIYLSDGDDPSLVVIPDVSVFPQSSKTTQTSSTLTLPAQSESVKVTLPIPEEFREGYLEIREGGNGYVVTVLEILSPTNKRAGIGREKYEKKRSVVLSRPTHLVEIDLLRGGQPMPILGQRPKSNYSILVSRENQRPRADLYPFSIRQSIPAFPIPLRKGDIEPVVDLQSLLVGVYNRARFDMTMDYNQEPVPPLKEEERVWADALLRESGRRG